MNIVLIGYRGTGKTATAKALSKKLNKQFISTDKILEKSLKKKIPEIVDSYGWEYFRDNEENIVSDISELDNLVIDCGGGAVLREENIKNLKKNGKIILLIASPATIKDRIKDSSDRPPLSEDKDFLEEVEEALEERKEAYASAADVVIDTENSTADEVADKIIKYLKNKELNKKCQAR